MTESTPLIPPSSDLPLRVGILLDSLTVRAWIARTVEFIHAADWALLALVVKNRATGKSPSNFLLKSWRLRRYLFYEAYSRFDRLWFRGDPDPFAPVDLRPLLAEKRLYRVAKAPVFRRPAFVVYAANPVDRALLEVALDGLREIALSEKEA